MAGWGFKPPSLYARAVTQLWGLPYLAVEDGFLRSIGLGEAGAQPVSLIADDLGIYYDASRPSRLEALLNDGGWESPALMERARGAMARLVDSGLSKTNTALARSPQSRPSRRRILVLDQTLGDASIRLGLAGPASFATMLAAARRDEPDAEIVVRLHPAVAAGLKRGHFPPSMLAGVTLADPAERPADLLARVDGVYTVTSLMGFEALMRGLPVRCFGVPFYAGWGATRDEIALPRRRRPRSTLELFAAAYLLYARYVDPLTGEACGLETAIDRLLAFRERASLNAGFTAALGFAPWKHGAARGLLYSPMGKTRFFASAGRAIAAARARSGRVVFWAGRQTPALDGALARAGVPVLRMEDGFIRSRGLGSDFHPAASVVLDELGVYYDATRPSRLERILERGHFDPAVLERAANLRARLVDGGLSKYNLAAQAGSSLSGPDGRASLLVVGQVENDKSIALGCEGVRTNLSLLEAARRDHPEAWILYKPHPDVEAGNRPGAISATTARLFADAVLEEADIAACIAAAEALATMTSLAGFEALLRGKAVHTYGRPFYAGWGLTTDALACPRRSRRLTLDELVAGALIAYPIYLDPASGLPCGPEEVVASLLRGGAGAEPRRWRYWRAVWESLRGARVVGY